MSKYVSAATQEMRCFIKEWLEMPERIPGLTKIDDLEHLDDIFENDPQHVSRLVQRRLNELLEQVSFDHNPQSTAAMVFADQGMVNDKALRMLARGNELYTAIGARVREKEAQTA